MSSKEEGKKVAYGSQSSFQKTSSRSVLPDEHLSESFSKKDRLLRRADFVRVQSRGRKVYTKSLLMMVLENRIGRTRLGIAVSKKIGNSVKRNKWKRIIREIFRRNRSLFPNTVDIVVIPKRIPYVISYAMLLEEMRETSLIH
jgi:ribonuclease P protein component, eubacterial